MTYHNTSYRYASDKIYTWTGPILISVNPFKSLDLYGDDLKDEYTDKTQGELPPHVYGISDRTFHAMLDQKENQ